MTRFDTALSNLGIGRTGTAAAASAAQTSRPGDASLGQDDFLRLMTAQLKNQDPFEPVDNSQMVAQMAQFSSLSGISEINSTLKAIAARLGSTSAEDAASWVGRNVLTEGGIAYPTTAGTLQGAIELDGAASDVTVTISNADGAILKTVSLGAQEAGQLDFAWDGTTDSGDPAGPGPFTIRVGAQGAEGNPVAARPLVWAPVGAVSFDGAGAPVLSLPGLGQVPVSAVRQIG